MQIIRSSQYADKILSTRSWGAKSDITALFVHSQDHLMTSITEINLIKEIIDLRKELKSWLKQKIIFRRKPKWLKSLYFVPLVFLQACW